MYECLLERDGFRHYRVLPEYMAHVGDKVAIFDFEFGFSDGWTIVSVDRRRPASGVACMSPSGFTTPQFDRLLERLDLAARQP